MQLVPLPLLESRTVAMTAKTITKKLDGLEPKTVQNTQATLVVERPPAIVATGDGRKNDPRLYSAVRKSLFECETSNSPQTENPEEPFGMVPGNQRGLFGNQCAQIAKSR